MTSPDWVAQAATEYLTGRPLALLFNFDGTLAAIASHPDRATLSPATRDALAVLTTLNEVQVGVVSSRGLASLKDLVDVPAAWYAGSGGMHLDLGGVEVVDGAVAAFDRAAAPLILALAEAVRWFPKAWVEVKPGCLAVHFRALSAAQVGFFVEEARYALTELVVNPAAIRLRLVTQALEVTPAGAWTKGDAAERMLGGWRRNAFAVYAGDGTSDEDAVAVVNAHRGLSVGVGPEPLLGAQVRVATQEAFAADLVRLAAELMSAQRTPRPGSRPDQVLPTEANELLSPSVP